MYLAGKIIGTHGIKGELKIKSDTSFNRFEKGNVLYFSNGEKNIKVKVSSHRVHKDMDLVTVNDLFDINKVLEFVGMNVYVKEHNDKLDDNQVYYEDLIESNVFDEGGNLIGVVNDIIELPKGLLLEVIKDDEKYLIPYVKDFVVNFSKKEKKIIIHVIEGLLW